MKNDDWKARAVDADAAVRGIRSGDKVFVHGAAATPTPLLEALARRTDLEGVELYHLHLNGPLPFTEPQHQGRFFSYSLFTGPGMRGPVAEGRADFVPVFLSDIPHLFQSRGIDLDVALLSLSPPDAHGHSTLGPSVDAALAAAHHAKRVIAEVNVRMPRTTGNSAIPFGCLDAFMASDRPIHALEPTEEGEVEARIGELIADLVQDGATLQMGIGAIPDAALARLGNKHELGVHTEMFSDRLIDLVEGGVVTNRHKNVHKGRTVTSFVMGSQRLYDFVDDNLTVEFYPCDRTNDTSLIRKNPKVVAINSAIEVDLTGQICADSMGHRIYSGIGGQMDF
ncbi:MAG: acetyl-CoA hydrolase/transferase family protein, partial [Myxococcales bacterium]|nr:acetyl-CoA hydrolase/transferase family protein [Myxococcales bacterium]